MNRRGFASILIVTGLVMSSASASERRQKAAWDWTDGERIAALLDVGARAARLEARRGRHADVAVDTAVQMEDRKPVDAISGERDPHLFFEWELFDHLIAITYGDNLPAREAFREAKARDAKGLFEVPPDFWDRLGAVAAPFISDRQRERELLRSPMPDAQRNAALEVLYDQLCRDRYAALQNAKEEFGPAFRRFLYGPIARGLNTTSYAERDLEVVTHVARGCE